MNTVLSVGDKARMGMHLKRKRMNVVALTLSLAAMAFGLFWLAWILFETIRLGIGGIALSVFTEMTPPPMAESADILRLYGTARELAAAHGYTLPKQHRGGGSDGNFTAAMGIPTLDGLGCTGHGAHAPDEHIRWRDLLCKLRQ